MRGFRKDKFGRVINPFDNLIIKKKHLCLKHDIPFDLDSEYLESIFTGYCGICGKKISFNSKNRDYKATLDRLVPSKGYTKGNVSFVSQKYNRLKSNLTKNDLVLLLGFFNKKEKENG